MNSFSIGDTLGVPTGWRRAAAWVTLAGCVLPLTVGWLYGVMGVTVLFAHRPDWLLLCYVGFAFAALGLATLWSALVPRALGRQTTLRLRRWQVLGLQLGGLSGLVLIGLLVSDARPSQVGRLLVGLTPLVWSFAAALYLAAEADE